MISCEHISCRYGKKEVLVDVSFALEQGEFLCIIGANGSGKTTLLHALMGLEKSSGQISVGGKSFSLLSHKERARHLALLAQHSHIEFPYTVYDTVALGRYCHKKNPFSPITQEEEALIARCIQEVGLWEEKDRLISSLSGGQLQRVYLARTFAQNPSVILLDEPTNHLDLKVQLELFHRLKEWVSLEKRGVIGVFHDLNVVRQFAQKVLLLHEGKVLAFGSVEEVMCEELLSLAFGLNVKEYMVNSFEKWV